MASLRFLFLASFFIVLSLSINIGEVQGANRKLLAPTFPDIGNIPGVQYPPFPPVTDWPEYRLPSFLRPNYPAIPANYYRYTPPAKTTTTTASKP